MIKRYRIPVLMGIVTAAIGFLITYADLTIYMGVNAATGIPLGYDGREIFIALCSALGGPLAAVIAILQFPFIGIYMSLPATGVAMVMLDRLVASLTVVFLYRFMYLHIKVLPFLTGNLTKHTPALAGGAREVHKGHEGEKAYKSSLVPPFVYSPALHRTQCGASVVPFVVELFPAKYGRAHIERLPLLLLFWAVISLISALEPPFAYVFTILILLSIPPRFRKPLWVSPHKPALEEKYVLKEDMA